MNFGNIPYLFYRKSNILNIPFVTSFIWLLFKSLNTWKEWVWIPIKVKETNCFCFLWFIFLPCLSFHFPTKSF